MRTVSLFKFQPRFIAISGKSGVVTFPENPHKKSGAANTGFTTFCQGQITSNCCLVFWRWGGALFKRQSCSAQIAFGFYQYQWAIVLS